MISVMSFETILKCKSINKSCLKKCDVLYKSIICEGHSNLYEFVSITVLFLSYMHPMKGNYNFIPHICNHLNRFESEPGWMRLAVSHFRHPSPLHGCQ